MQLITAAICWARLYLLGIVTQQYPYYILYAHILSISLMYQLDLAMRFHADICICGFAHMRIYFQHAHNPYIDISGLCGYAHYAHVFSEPHM